LRFLKGTSIIKLELGEWIFMKKKNAPNKMLTKNIIITCIFVVAIVVIGISMSYAYYSANIAGKASAPDSKAGKLNVTTTLTTASAINAAKLALINNADYLTKAEKVTFSITNNADSTVKGKYTIKLVEMSLSKNMFSKYFKWSLVVNAGTSSEKTFNGNFADATVAAEGNSDTTIVTDLTKTLITDDNAITIDIGATDNIVFYIWLENDDAIDQIYLTNGDFKGKLSMEAIPTR